MLCNETWIELPCSFTADAVAEIAVVDFVGVLPLAAAVEEASKLGSENEKLRAENQKLQDSFHFRAAQRRSQLEGHPSRAIVY